MTWTHTSLGRALDLLDPDPAAVDLLEIARALGNQCRYAGCVTRFYSVAEHCVLISRWLETDGHPREVQLAGLLHDAAEAYTGDITWPMQAVLWGDDEVARISRERYRRCQERLDRIVAALAGVDPELLHCDAVKTADLRILLDERAALLTEPPPRPWAVEAELGLSPLGVEIDGWPPKTAGAVFAARLHDLRAVDFGGMPAGSP